MSRPSFRFAVCVVGELLNSLPMSQYKQNVVQVHTLVSKSWSYGTDSVFRSGHLSGDGVSDMHSLFRVLHTFPSPPYSTLSQERQSASRRALFRTQISDVLTLLTHERIASCLIVRVDVFVEMLSRPRSYAYPHVVSLSNAALLPFEGLLMGRVSSFRSCGMGSASVVGIHGVAGNPSYLLKSCCVVLKCKPFTRYSASVHYSNTGVTRLESPGRSSSARVQVMNRSFGVASSPFASSFPKQVTLS